MNLYELADRARRASRAGEPLEVTHNEFELLRDRLPAAVEADADLRALWRSALREHPYIAPLRDFGGIEAVGANYFTGLAVKVVDP